MIGQDAVTTAQAFQDGVGFDGVVLTKLDGDARGGAALSIAGDHRPAGDVRLAPARSSTDFDALPPRPDGLAHPRHGRRAHPDRAGREDLRRRPGRGDGGQAHRPGEDFTLDDFLEQMQQLCEDGLAVKKMLGMLPGMGQFRDQLENFDEREIDRIQAIIQSMTPAERRQPQA